MELKYILAEPLVGEKRSYSSSSKRALHNSSKGMCQICNRSNNDFNFNDLDACRPSGIRTNLEIAHIYGLKNFTRVEHSGNKFHINSVLSLNEYDNLIILCGKCHKKYDKRPSYKKYVEMFYKKKDIFKDDMSKYYIKNKLEFYLEDMEKVFSDFVYNSNSDYEVVTFNEKMEINHITDMKVEKYRMYLVRMGTAIDEFFIEHSLEAKRLLDIFREIYITLSERHEDRNEILNILSRHEDFESLNLKLDNELFDGLISYMIWKCVVLDKNVTA